MRALSGAIITCGALIGLGLTMLGVGQRYSWERTQVDGRPYIMHLGQMDVPFVFALVFITSLVVVGLGITFLGLAYHHHRREREHQWERERLAAHHRTTV